MLQNKRSGIGVLTVPDNGHVRFPLSVDERQDESHFLIVGLVRVDFEHYD